MTRQTRYNGVIAGLWHAYRLRWKRRRFLFRIWRHRGQITPVKDRTANITDNAILVFSTVRNEALRLPHFLAYYRKLGIDHFLFVDNNSDDGTAEYLARQPDVSLWTTSHSYRLARFGMDWLGWLLWRYGHGHWCLTVDADELLAYADSDRCDLKVLTGWMDAQNIRSFGTLMLDLYPKGPPGQKNYQPGDDPIKLLNWFDTDNYRHQHHGYYGNIWIQGGARDRVFFAKTPERAPTLNKTPLVRWHWRYAYVSATHQILPPRLHDVFTQDGRGNGVLLHTKFLPDITARSAEELHRKQHFGNSAFYTAYHRRLIDDPDLWHKGARAYHGPQSLIDAGLMSAGPWVGHV